MNEHQGERPGTPTSAAATEPAPRPGGADPEARQARRGALALRALEEVACAPAQASLLMEICVDRVQEMVGGTGGAVALLQEGELFYSTTAGDLRGRLSGSQPIAHTFGGLTVTTGQTLYTGDAQSDPRVARDIVTPLGLRSLIATPLRQGRRRIGVLWVSSPDLDAFDQTDVDLVSRLGRVAGARLDFALVREERRSSERALVDSRLQHAAVLASLDQGVMVVDPGRRVQLVNGAAERILGVPRERLIASDAFGMPWGAICENGSPLDAQAPPAADAPPTTKPGGHILVGVHRPDGERRWLSVTTVPVLDPSGGTLRGLVASFTDVTDERERTEWQDRQRRLLDTTERLTSAGGWHWQPDSTGPHWSAGMYRLLGLPDADVDTDHRKPSARAYFDRVHPADRARVRRGLFSVLREGGCRTLEHRLVWPDGRQCRVRCSVEALLGPDGRVSAAWGACHHVPDPPTATHPA